MKLSSRIGVGLTVLGIVVLGGCGGSDDATTVPSDLQVSADRFSQGFGDQTGLDLEGEPLPGGARLLVPGKGKEVEFLRDYGNARIYVVEDGDPDLVFEASVGQDGTSRPAKSGKDSVTIETEVASEPDGDGVVWTRNCVTYEKQKDLNTCAWTGTKRYGRNLIVSWTQASEGLTDQGRRLDEAVTSAADGSSTGSG